MTARKTTSRSSGQLLQLKIELSRIKPLIWRRILVPETVALAKLHRIIQAAMGWTDSHLHEFEIAGERYGVPDPEFDFGEPVISEVRTKLGKSLGGDASLRYVYDFGDDWEHKIKVEKVLPADVCPTPVYLGGANACPPEHVGSPYGYVEFLEAIADSAHPEHEHMLGWHGGPFDPAAIDHDLIQARLQRIKL
ncbi:plasmid pRiA4b ORF-3 family protein [Burkholderia vietnamiensis]|uniref:plasmid pRiA4b ORF-3 family protein n=1 Tax=Burkholderia vietnamiensis TaxID=60552 RepID=UPI001CF50E65|nr:plasmid pRiA4b ORF-3 family protein [Burkholderia vietnamiensis]MCA8449328.1 plasmid pRiA4b ORF-3 family protein [Burkholderia vietnamiensis]HDR8951492.1 plasmid pRiA4b ORF-3 family protein [Burkholderia vietnamiensis]